MKNLIYAMQSSGASLFSYWLSQQQNCLSVIDLYYNEISPSLEHNNVVVKCVINKNYTIEDHISSLNPDRVILFVRNPIENYLSLSEKIYANYGGTIEEKMYILDSILNKKKYDFIVKYEDFILGKVPKNLGCSSYFEFNKTLDDIKQYNFSNSNWCKINYNKKWGFGNIHANKNNLFLLKKFKSYSNILKIY